MMQWGIWIEGPNGGDKSGFIRFSPDYRFPLEDGQPYAGPAVFNGEAGAQEFIELRRIAHATPRQIPDHLRFPPYPEK